MSRTVQALEDAARRLSSQDITGAGIALAFDTLLDAWRSFRAAEIASLCESLSARLSPNLAVKGLDARSQQERAVAWASAFREHSPLGLAPLLVDFERCCRERPQPRLVFPRADALSTVRDDPRIAPVMLRGLSTIAGGSAWQKVLLRYFRALEAAGDPRVIHELSRILDLGGQGLSSELNGSLRDHVFERAPQTLEVLQARFADGVPALPHELRALVDEIGERIALLDAHIALDLRRGSKTERRGHPDSLLREVYASPDDDDARHVLADALMERADPRGEFIVLQMRRAAGESTPKMHAREKALLKANTRAWLGPLAAVAAVKSVVFERGFLARCEATAKSRAIETSLKSLPQRRRTILPW